MNSVSFQCEKSRDESHWSRKSGNKTSVILRQKFGRVWERSGASFLERLFNSQDFDYFDDFFEKQNSGHFFGHKSCFLHFFANPL